MEMSVPTKYRRLATRISRRRPSGSPTNMVRIEPGTAPKSELEVSAAPQTSDASTSESHPAPVTASTTEPPAPTRPSLAQLMAEETARIEAFEEARDEMPASASASKPEVDAEYAEEGDDVRLTDAASAAAAATEGSEGVADASATDGPAASSAAVPAVAKQEAADEVWDRYRRRHATRGCICKTAAL